MTTEQRLDNIDSRLAALLAVAEIQQGDITALTENIDDKTSDQVGEITLPSSFTFVLFDFSDG